MASAPSNEKKIPSRSAGNDNDNQGTTDVQLKETPQRRGKGRKHRESANNSKNIATSKGSRASRKSAESKAQVKGEEADKGEQLTKRELTDDLRNNGSSSSDNESSDDENDNICFICAEPVKFWAVGECDHRTCYLCNLRLRALFKSKACPYCKSDTEHVIYTPDHAKPFAEYNKSEFKYNDKKLGIDFSNKPAYDAAMYALHFNCPQRRCKYADATGWNELKEHARAQHSLMFCDLCLKHKKSFAHEHKLFTKSQLRAHYSHGDNTGFPGHPRCEFCSTAFYDNDQLFDHCHKKHEQCFICVRNGSGRQVYYKNYLTLEDHFANDHFQCKHQSCLERKFVVFENELDLQAHELEVHGKTLSGQRARREARQVNVDIRYSLRNSAENSRTSTGGRRGATSRQNSRPQTMTVNGPDSTGVSIAGRRRPGGFGHISESVQGIEANSSNETPSPPVEPTSIWPGLSSGSDSRTLSNERSHLDHIRGRAPTEFGRLSDERSLYSEGSASSPIRPETLNAHQELLQRVSAYLSYREQPVARFRSLTTQYKDGDISADDYVQNCWLLFLTAPGKNAKEMIRKTMNSVASLLPDSSKKAGLTKALNDHRIKQQQFPALTPLTGSSKDSNSRSNSSARVLVIKKTNNGYHRNGWATPSNKNSISSRNLNTPGSASPSGFPALSPSSSASSFSSLRNSVASAPRPGYSNAVAPQTVSRSNSNTGRTFGYGETTHSSTSLSNVHRNNNRSTESEFPTLPPSKPQRAKIEPVTSTSLSAWSGTGSSTQTTKKAQKKQSKNTKGKQVLFYVG